MTHDSPAWNRVIESLAGTIERAEASGAVLGVAAIFPGGERYAHNAGRRFVAASTVKIAIMIALFRQVDASAELLDREHVVRAEDHAGGSGVIGKLHVGLRLTLADLAYLMMSISDNSATNILIDHLGMDHVNATMRDLGMTASTLGRKMAGRPVLGEEQENWAVPDDYATAVAAVLDNRAATPAACARMLALMELQQNDRRMARHLPRVGRPRWGSKTGSLPGVVNDVGYVFTPSGPLVLAVFVERVADPHLGEQIVGDVARAALNI